MGEWTEWKAYLRKDKVARSINLGLTKYSKQLNPYVTLSSIIITVITIFVVINSVTKWAEVNKQSIRALDEKFVDREVFVRDTVRVSNCDTVYIIDGVKFIKAGE